MLISSTVNIELKGLENFTAEIKSELASGYGPVNKALKLWAVRYRSFAQQRYDIFSKGGGDWKKLSKYTLDRRRKGPKSNSMQLRLSYQTPNKPAAAATKQPAILRDTGILFAALAPIYVGSPGAIEENIANGIRVGYGGPQRHIGTSGRSNNKTSHETIADIAAAHQNGFLPKLPKREIIVSPPQSIVNDMVGDIEKAMRSIANGG